MPKNSPSVTGWEQHVLIEGGPDVHVTMHTLEDRGQNYSVIVTGTGKEKIAFCLSKILV